MKFKGIGAAAFVAAVFASTAARADDAPDFEITPFGAFRFGGSFEVEESTASYELDDSESYGLIFNFRHSDNTQWELFYSRQETDAEFSEETAGDAVVDMDMHTLQIGGTYLWEIETVQPYLAATIGGTHVEARSNGTDSDTFFSGSIGLGLRIRPSERVGLRLEARAHGVLTRSSTDLFCQTGPDLNVCAVEIAGEFLGQIETFAGVVFRF